jgi:hypothetical protein
MQKGENSIDETRFLELDKKLRSRGFVKVDASLTLQKGQYHVSSHTGDALSFGSVRKYNVTWHE